MRNDFAALGSYVQESMQSWQIPGVALAILKEDEVLHMAGYGVCDVEQGTPVTPDTLFAIASVTKAFTAMGVALLVDEGKVEWDKPVRTYLPEFRLKDSYVSERITLRDLLSHRSGLPRHDLSWYGTDFDRAAILKNLQYYAFSKGFRETWQYQNLMYMTAGYLVGAVTGSSWEDFTRRRIFEPLNMKRSCFSPDEMQKQGNYATPYRIKHTLGEPDKLEAMEHYTSAPLGPAGSIHSSVADLANWLRVHLNAGQFGDQTFVSPGNVQQMHLPQMVMPMDSIQAEMLGTTISLYGMGWFVVPYRGYTLIHHGGNIDGFSLIVGFVPQQKVGVAVLTNIEGRPLRDVLLYEAVDRVLDLPDNHWNIRFHKVWDAIYAAMDQDKVTTSEERVSDKPTSHPLADYAGEYAADGYADFKVRQDGDGLQAWIAGDWFPLTHYHYDIFNLDVARFEMRVPVSFFTDVTGEISAVSVPIEPAVENIIFKRKPITIEPAVLAALVGVYTMPFEGMELFITLKQDKLFMHTTGHTDEELLPFRVTAAGVEFKLKSDEKNRLEVVRDAQGNYHLAILKEPGSVYHAPRKA